ncbi:LTA synthase family protein [Evansella clarkii]|uniref:LTA synthase family protein n=1 Tax=Evansella clarkii TaxID=79879 RepID=UPI000996E139|nr:LTA synthase family protein [Evansella clarkii]
MNAFIKNHKFMLLALLLMWLKTIVVSGLTFNINYSGFMQTAIFIFNPFVFLAVVFSIGLLFTTKVQKRYYIIVSAILTGVLYANSVYFREFSDIITLPMLVMSANMGDLSTSIIQLIYWYDIFFFADLVVLGALVWKTPESLTLARVYFPHSKKVFGMSAVVVLMIISVFQPGNTSSETRTHSFNRDHLVQSMGLYNFYLYDAYVHTQTSTQTVFADREDWADIEAHLEEHQLPGNPEYFGAAEDMNVIVVSLESVESFVIGETIDGEEITPFLNELIEDSLYFENFYYQTGQGKTSDAEFMINNSLYPLGRGAVFHTNADNEYDALPEILADNGYYTASFHANDETFYNRNIMYENLGYERYFSLDDYEVDEENSVGWGMKDIDFVEQTMEHIETVPKPFYATLLTLTNHFPYELDKEDHFISEYDSESEILNRYFPTVRYTDEAMKLLVEQLKEDGLYENTMIVMYGDHYGIAESHYDALGEFLEKDMTLKDVVELNRVPLIIHIPGMEGKTYETVSGQIDVKPTLLNLLGIPVEDQLMFGRDLLAEDRDNFAVLRNGTVVTDEYIYVSDNCLDAESGTSVPLEKCIPLMHRGERDLYYSDKIIYGDLFRFR